MKLGHYNELSMTGNTIGQLFTVTTCGESHGPAMMAIVDGCPPGLSLCENDIQLEVDRRRPGQSRYISQRQELDKVQILSGVFEGKTTGAPIGLLVLNTDQRSSDYETIKNTFRPGHADFTYHHKYGHRDYRGGGRSSARETVLWVAAGAIAKKYLREQVGLQIIGYLSAMGDITPDQIEYSAIAQNHFFFPDLNKVPVLETLISQCRRDKDSIGAKVSVIARNVPIGLGEPVFDKLDAEIAKAMMGINAAKGVEIGDGFAVVNQLGSAHRDEMTPDGFLSNHAGGILGGISTGQEIIVHVAFKPTSSLPKPAQSVTVEGKPVEVVTKGRHDPCVGIRAVPVVEARLAMVLMDFYLRNKTIAGPRAQATG